MDKIIEVTNNELRENLPRFRSGDTVSVGVKVIEGDKSRVQQFEGTVISVFLIFMFLFFLGFPSKYSEQMIDYKNYKNSIVFTCELNQIFIEYDNVLNFENCKDSLQKKDSIYKYNSVGLKANLQSIPFTNLVFAIYLCLNLYKIRNKLE